MSQAASETAGLPADVVAKARPIAVRDAATLVVIDDEATPPKILVGLRGQKHVFMAGKLVFPGGRVDPSDLGLARGFELLAPDREKLLAGTRTRFDARRATALALAAIRETYEETGLMLGRAGDFTSTAPFWRDFAERGIRPDPQALRPFARAITPPSRVRRYDTRFLAVRSDAVAHRLRFEDRPTDEFETVAWMTIDEMFAQDLAAITRMVLADLAARLADGSLEDPNCPIPFYRQVRGRAERTLL